MSAAVEQKLLGNIIKPPLKEIDMCIQRFALLHTHVLDVLKCLVPVDVRLADSEQVEIWPVDNEHRLLTATHLEVEVDTTIVVLCDDGNDGDVCEKSSIQLLCSHCSLITSSSVLLGDDILGLQNTALMWGVRGSCHWYVTMVRPLYYLTEPQCRRTLNAPPSLNLSPG